MQGYWPITVSRDEFSATIVHELDAGASTFPFSLYLDGAKVGVRAGRVYSGDGLINATALASATVSADDQFILTVKYYGNATPDTAVISKVASGAITDWLTYSATSDPTAGWSQHVFVLGEITSGAIVQRRHGDLYFQKGKTWQQYMAVSVQFSDPTESYTRHQITWVNGQCYAVAASNNVTVWTGAICPDP